jgi:hypothetical protein
VPGAVSQEPAIGIEDDPRVRMLAFSDVEIGALCRRIPDDLFVASDGCRADDLVRNVTHLHYDLGTIEAAKGFGSYERDDGYRGQSGDQRK